jgi:hypothetical protein
LPASDDPGAGARLEEDIVGPEARQVDGKARQRRRGRELLEGDLVFAAHRVGRQFPSQRLERADRSTGVHSADQFRDCHGQRHLKRLEALALGPGSRRIVAARAFGHGLRERRPVDRNGEQELGGKRARSAENGAAAGDRSGHGGLREIL